MVDLPTHNTDKIQSLTAEQAYALVRPYPVPKPLVGPGSKAAVEAAVLDQTARRSTPLYLNGLTELPVEVAAALAQYEGPLFLSGLKSLTPDVACALAAHDNALHLDGLNALSPESARVLSAPWLSLAGLRELPDDLAQSLGCFGGSVLLLDGLESISLKALTRLITDESYFGVSLNGLRDLSPELARALSGGSKPLYLDGLTALTPEAAEAITQHRHSHSQTGLATLLSLNGLKSLPLSVAQLFGSYHGDLSLDGLIEIDREAARPLSRAGGCSLSLNGLTNLTPEVANMLGASRGDLFLNGIQRICEDTAEAFWDFHDGLFLNGISYLSDEVASALTRKRRKYRNFMNGALHLDGLASLSDSAAAFLACGWGHLCLNGLLTLTDVAASALATDGHSISLEGLVAISESAASTLRANRLMRLPAKFMTPHLRKTAAPSAY